MVSKIKKEMTISQLVEMVARGFDSVDKRFDAVDERFNTMDGRFGRIESTMVTKAEFNRGIGKLGYRIDEIHEILRRLEETDILGLQKRVMDLEKIVRVMSKKLELAR